MTGSRGLAALGLAVSLLLGACASSAATGRPAAGGSAGVGPSSSAAPPTSPAATAVPSSPVVGVVLKVDSAGLDKVSGFTLRTGAGQTVVFSIGILENGAQFPPGHLAEHLATAVPVRAWFRDDGGKLVVYRIEDAG